MVTPQERAALLDGLFELIAPRSDRERALQFLAGDVRRLCYVRYAASALLAEKAHRYYAELPPADGDDFRDALIGQVRLYAGQFPEVVGVPKRAEVTAALQEVIDG